MKFCIHIDIDKMYPWDCQMTFEIGWVFAEVQILKKKKWDHCKMIFIIGWGFAECQILKKWKWPYLLNWVEYFDRPLHKKNDFDQI